MNLLYKNLPQNQALNIALEAENDIRRQKDHVQKNEEVIRQVRLQVPHPPSEVAGANMPQMAGVIPLTIRVGIPLISYKLNKIESARPKSDYVYFYLEKYCAMMAYGTPSGGS